MLARGIDHDTELAGVPIEAGTTAFVCVHVLHRDPQTWQDAEAFDPHRREHPPTGTYLPFGDPAAQDGRVCEHPSAHPVASRLLPT